LRRRRTRTRRRSLHALAVLLLAGGCGGDGESAPPRPSIEAATAERLAATSESIAELLDQGDVCTAAGRADELRAQVTEAINAGAVPARFQEELSSKANELVNTVNCPPPPAEEPEDEKDDEADEDAGRGEGNGEDKDKEKKDGGDDLLPTVEIPPTVTEDE
jgi:hypothetical protein